MKQFGGDNSFLPYRVFPNYLKFFTKFLLKKLANKGFIRFQLIVGGVVVNDIPTVRFDIQPYGGVKLSGVGREGAKFALEEFTEIKSVVIF